MKLPRLLVSLLLILAICSLVFSCGDDDSADDDDDNDDDDTTADDDDDAVGPPRSFYMASAPFIFEVTDISISSEFDFTGFDGRVDMVSLHMDNFFGLPWPAFIAGTDPPDVWLEKMAQIRAEIEALGVGVYLSLTPLGGIRDQIADLAEEVDGELFVNNAWLPGCYNFDTGPNHAAHRTGYLNFVRWMVDYFQPEYLTHGIEINIYDLACPDDYDSVITLLNDVYDQGKAIDPSLPIFGTFASSMMWFEGEIDCWPNDRTCLRANLAKIEKLKQDRYGVSSYPIWVYNELPEWPTDYYRAFAEEQEKTVVFGEIGWNTHDVTIPYPTLEDSCMTVTHSSDADQIAFLDHLFSEAQTMGSDLVVWWSLRDFLFEQILTGCPCDAPGLWCLLYDAVYDIGLLPSWVMWGSMGVIDFDAKPKPGYNAWKNWLERTKQ
jgi:hypothetical protein